MTDAFHRYLRIFSLAGIVAVLCSFGGIAEAGALTGALWINQSGVASNALLSSLGILGTPDAIFNPGAINYNSTTTSYTVGGFLNNPVFSSESAAFITAGGGSAALNNTVLYITGTIGLNAGANSFVVGHDDGLQMNIDGLGLVENVPGPTAFTNTPFNVNAPSAGNYDFEIMYGECCGAPAALLLSINNVTIGNNVPEPGTVALVGTALAGLVFARRRKAI